MRILTAKEKKLLMELDFLYDSNEKSVYLTIGDIDENEYGIVVRLYENNKVEN